MKIALRRNATSTLTYDFTELPPQFRTHFHKYITEMKNTQKKAESTLIAECRDFFTYTAPFFDSIGLESFAQIDAQSKQLFVVHLNSTILRASKKNTNKRLSQGSKRRIFISAKNYFTWLTKHHKESAPELAHFSPNPYSKGANANLKTKAIDETASEMIRKKLKDETNPYIKAFIAVASLFGLRIEDILELKHDCISDDPDKPEAYMYRYYNHKDSQWYKKPVPKNNVTAVTALKVLGEHTEELRQESGDERLFIWKVERGGVHGEVGSIRRYTQRSVSDWLKSYIKRHGILNADGSAPHITPHMLRHDLFTSMDEKGVALENTQHVADHKHSSTTRRYYIHSRDKSYNEQMDESDKMADSIFVAKDTTCVEDEVFHDNKVGLTLADGYCRNTKMATDDEYVCEHYTKRGNCYGCSKLLTTPDFLDYFYDQLAKKEQELDDNAPYGENTQRQIHFQIEMIKKLIKKLEALVEEEEETV